MNKSYKYILRYLICPNHSPDDRIDELIQLCQDGTIDEVMLLFTAEELTDGHSTLQEIKPWVEVAKKLKERLARHGVTLSLNPWTTTFHIARGRRLKPGQDFTLMVGETGEIAKITACPLCLNWQEYLCELFAWIAGEVQPTALWVEDDWRLHNHEPGMGFGGCFCHLHLERFASMVGRSSVTREEVLEHLLAPGEPDPWRQKWMELWGQTLIEPARKLRSAVQEASPNTRMALMSSDPDIHSIEGRDWHGLQEALGDEPAFIIRPHLPPYFEMRALPLPPTISRLTLANCKPPMEIYPEIENARCGVFSKSHRYTLMQCLESVCYGSDGITINHFDMMGNGASLDPGFAASLRGPKGVLSAVCQLGVKDENAQGATVLFHPRVSEFCHVEEGQDDLMSLKNRSTGWAKVLSILGCSNRLCQSSNGESPVFVCGQTLRAFDDERIVELLKGVLVCDAPSSMILMERGFSEHIGLRSGQYRALDDLGYAYEEICESDPSVYGIVNPRVTASGCSNRLFVCEYDVGASLRSIMRNGRHEEVSGGVAVFENSLGGKVVSVPYELETSLFYMKYFNVYRMAFWRQLLFELFPQSPLAIMENHPLRVYRSKTSSGTFIGLVNPLLDDCDSVVMRVGAVEENASETLRVLDKTNRWVGCPVSVEVLPDKSQRWIIDIGVKNHEAAYFLF